MRSSSPTHIRHLFQDTLAISPKNKVVLAKRIKQQLRYWYRIRIEYEADATATISISPRSYDGMYYYAEEVLASRIRKQLTPILDRDIFIPLLRNMLGEIPEAWGPLPSYAVTWHAFENSIREDDPRLYQLRSEVDSKIRGLSDALKPKIIAATRDIPYIECHEIGPSIFSFIVKYLRSDQEATDR
jgi:hypothetical protein